MNKERKEHYKMYKDGKKWIFCSLMVISVALGTGLVSTHAAADMVNKTTTEMPSSSTSAKSTTTNAPEAKPTPVEDATSAKKPVEQANVVNNPDHSATTQTATTEMLIISVM